MRGFRLFACLFFVPDILFFNKFSYGAKSLSRILLVVGLLLIAPFVIEAVSKGSQAKLPAGKSNANPFGVRKGKQKDGGRSK